MHISDFMSKIIKKKLPLIARKTRVRREQNGKNEGMGTRVFIGLLIKNLELTFFFELFHFFYFTFV